MRRFIAILTLIGATAAACGGSTTDPGVERSVSAAPVAPPTGEVVLTISGDDARSNVGDQVQMDLEGLEALGVVTETIFEPFVSEEVVMTGVPLVDVLRAAGIGEDTPLVWTALDDYQVSYTLGELMADDGLLATRLDGEPIPVSSGGPIRVVFRNLDGPIGRNTNQWIWSLATIEAG